MRDETESRSEQPSSVHSSAIEKERVRLEFQCRYNIEIVSDYESHYRRVDTGCALFSIFFGIFALANVGGLVDAWVLGVAGALSSVIAILSSVHGFGRLSAEESFRKSAYERILTILTSKDAGDRLDYCSSAMNDIVDPKRNEISRIACYNEVVDQMGLPTASKRRVGFFQYHTRFLFK